MIKITPSKLFCITLLGIGLVYLVYLPVSYDFDGTVFSHYLRYALLRNDLKPVLQPHHLLYFPVNYILYKLFFWLFGYQVLEYFHLQLFSLMFGLMSLVIIYRILKHLVESQFFQIMGVILISCTYGFWYYSVEAEVHMAGLFFILWGIYNLLFKPTDLKHLIWIACLFSLAAGFHLTNGLIAITVLLFFIYGKKSWILVLKFYLFYLFFLAIPYFIFSLFTRIDLFKHFKNILFGKNIFSGYRINRWETLSLKSVAGSIQSAGKVILFPFSQFSILLSLVLLLLMVVFIVFFLIKKPEVKRNGVLMVFWVLPYLAFFTLWETYNLEFKLNVTIPICILFIYLLSLLKQKILKNTVIIFLLLGIGFFNYFSRVLPGSRFENNQIYQMAAAIKEKSDKHSIIMIAGCGSDTSIYSKIYIPYFGHRHVYILDWMLGKGFSFQDIQEKIDQDKSAGKSIYILSELLKPGKAVKQLVRNHHLDVEKLLAFIRGFLSQEKVPLTGDYYLLKI